MKKKHSPDTNNLPAAGETPAPQAAAGSAGRRKRRLLLALLMVLVVAGTVLVNVLAAALSERAPLSLDLTANAAYEAGAETRELLAGLTRDVDLYVLTASDTFGGNAYLIQAQRMLEQYPRLSPRVKLTYVDYVSDPMFASRFPNLTLSQGDVLVTCGDMVRQLQISNLFNYEYSDSGNMTITSSRTEEAVSAAIAYVAGGRQVTAAFLTGNGEPDKAAFGKLLTDNNFEVESLNLATDDIGASVNILMLIAPQIDLSEDSLKKLDDFLFNNGKYGKTLFYCADVTQKVLPNLEAFLKEWGVAVEDGVVFETTASLTYQYQPYYPVAGYVNETYKGMLKDAARPMLMPLSRPLTVLFTNKDNNHTEILAQFGETSGVRPSSAQDTFTAKEAARWGPIPAFVLASKQIYGTTGYVEARSNVLVSASAAMLDEYSLHNTSLADSEYVLDVLNSLSERKDAIAIEPKSLSGKTLALSSAQSTAIGVLLAAVLPLAVLAAGTAIWLVRRYQ